MTTFKSIELDGWQPIATMPEGMKLETCVIENGGVRMEQKLVRSGHLFFAGDFYVYYTPTHWRPE